VRWPAGSASRTTRNDVIRFGPANPLGTGPLASSINRTHPDQHQPNLDTRGHRHRLTPPPGELSTILRRRADDGRARPTVRRMSGDVDRRPAGAPADPRARLGRRGEDLACELLIQAGLRIAARNWRCREGEIDVVATGPGLLVVCEVKTRRGDGFGSAAAAVTWSKQRRLRRLAAAYLAGAGLPPVTVRFDVVAVTWPRGRAPVAEHIPGAF